MQVETPKNTKKSLPADVEDKRTKVTVEQRSLKNTATSGYHSMYDSMGVDNSFNLDEFKKNFKIKIISMDENDMVFEMIGIDAALANVFRRIMISEVPTMCIETVYFHDNTSIIQDEILAHRLGLIPLKVDPRLYEYRETDADYNEVNTLMFHLKVECTRKSGSKDTDPLHEKYNYTRVYSKDLLWEPVSEQSDTHADNPPRPVHDDILIAKLRPGQKIDAVCYCAKGVGSDHAKFSPVSTASYRLLPEITFKEPVTGADAKALVDLCPMNVFDIEDLGKVKRAVVKNPRNCSMCRECIRSEEWNKKVKLQRVKDHFIFSVESTGMYRPEEIFEESIKIFMTKLAQLKKDIEQAVNINNSNK
jgi:DNA-directed RNA polymerase I and III subunit RPAC1